MFTSLSYLHALCLETRHFLLSHLHAIVALSILALVWYCAIIRVQRRKEEAVRLMIASLKPGVIVHTSTGVKGEVLQVFDTTLVVFDRMRGPVEVFKYVILSVHDACRS